MVGEKELEYGYSSGIYVKHVSASTPIRSLPTQQDIDALGGGKTVRDWEARFELAYQRAGEEDVRSVMGVTPVITNFARYVQRKHKKLPRDLWRMGGIFCTSVAKIHTYYAPTCKSSTGMPMSSSSTRRRRGSRSAAGR
jgi:hypothetical protein